MVKLDWIKYSFHAYIISWMIGISLKIMQYQFSDFYLLGILLLMILFSVGALLEIWNGNISKPEKIRYTIGSFL
jgi:hypothetical protein